jgi:hypothetical protein
MKFTIVKDPIPFLVIDDTYNKNELVKIYQELEFLFPKLKGPEETSSAVMGSKIKNNTGIFLDKIYLDRKISDILQVNRKLFSTEVCDVLTSAHYAYNLYRRINSDNTLVSYYDEGGNYFSHYDVCTITSLSWFFKEPKNFYGGEFKFSDYNIPIEVKNNRTVIFFSSYMHEVSTVQLIEKNIPTSGRFTISQFCRII